MWFELGIFGLALAFGFWQLQDLKREARKRKEKELASKASESGSPKP